MISQGRTTRGQAGFTLIEIVVVIAIMGLLIAIALPSFLGARQRAYVAEARQIGSEWKSLSFACGVEKNFNASRCDTSTEIGWTAPASSNVWDWTTAAFRCMAAEATVTAALDNAGAAPPCGATDNFVRLDITGIGDMAGKTYRLAVGLGSTVRGQAGDLVTP